MPTVFPTASALSQAFSASSPTSLLQPRRTSREAPEHIWTSWSTTDDVKAKAAAVGDKAVHEYEKASAKAQEKVGKIELFSPKYYAACTFGGLLACVSEAIACRSRRKLTWFDVGSHPHSRHAARSCQMSSPGRLEDVQGQLRSLGQDRSR